MPTTAIRKPASCAGNVVPAGVVRNSNQVSTPSTIENTAPCDQRPMGASDWRMRFVPSIQMSRPNVECHAIEGNRIDRLVEFSNRCGADLVLLGISRTSKTPLSIYLAQKGYRVANVPLVLGSWWGLMMVPLFVALLAVRVRIEERALIEGLPGYADYAARVRYRLVPGVW